MGFKSSSLLCLALMLAFSSAIYAFDITQLLGQNPEFSTFNKYITETKLAEQINSRNTITVLAVDNGAIGSIAGKSPELIKAIISTHVILDYFDERKLMEAQGSNQQMTTLFQASGNAVNQQGFLKVALVGEGEIAFGSAASGAPTDVELVRTVTTEPYNISILQVTKPIIAPGLDSQTPASPASAQAPQAAKLAPAPAQSAKAPVQAAKAPAPAQASKTPAPAQATNASAPTQASKTPAPAQAANAPVPSSQGAKAPVSAQNASSPAPAQSAKAPTTAETAATPSPSSESVADSPQVAAGAPGAAEGPASGPMADEADSAPADSGSSTTKMGLVGAVMAFASFWIVL